MAAHEADFHRLLYSLRPGTCDICRKYVPHVTAYQVLSHSFKGSHSTAYNNACVNCYVEI